MDKTDATCPCCHEVLHTEQNASFCLNPQCPESRATRKLWVPHGTPFDSSWLTRMAKDMPHRVNIPGVTLQAAETVKNPRDFGDLLRGVCTIAPGMAFSVAAAVPYSANNTVTAEKIAAQIRHSAHAKIAEVMDAFDGNLDWDY